MVSKKTLILTVSALIIIIAVLTSVIVMQRIKLTDPESVAAISDINVIDLRYNDTFDKIDIIDSQGNKAEIQFSEKNNLLFYLSSTCGSCADVLHFSERIEAVFGEELSIYYIWSDTIPVSLLEQYGIKEENCFMMDNSVLSAATPSAYLVSESGHITYFNSDVQLVIEKLHAQSLEQFNNEEKLRANAGAYLKKHFQISDFVKKQVVYFYMDGCSDCAAADNILGNKKVKEELDLYYLYKYDDAEPSHYKDDYALFKLIFDIKWYPSFLMFQDDGNIKIIGEVPPDKLPDEILN